MDIEVTQAEYQPGVTLNKILIDFLKEKFPHHTIEYLSYISIPDCEGKASELKINNKVIGWLIKNETAFIPYSHINIKPKYRELQAADPHFLEIFHKMAIWEVGYDPLRAYTYMLKYDIRNSPDMLKIY